MISCIQFEHHADGKPIGVLFPTRNVVDTTGQVVGVSVVNYDVTDLKTDE
jgi:hypothetical protein